MRAWHALNFALHPHIEYARISDVLEKPPEQVKLADVEDALQAVFESHENVAAALDER